MKINTSTTFDPLQVCRVRLELENTQRSFFDEELIYKESATKEAISGVCSRYHARIKELRDVKFDLRGKLTVISLPHGSQTLVTEESYDFDDTDLYNLKTLFIMYSNQLINS